MTALPEAKAWCLDCCLPPGAADDYCSRCGGDNLAWIPASHLAPPMTEGDEAQAAPLPEGEAEQAMPQPERGAHAAPLPEELVRCMPVPAGMTSILQLTDVSTHRTARAHMLGDRRQNSISHDRADSQIE